ncbi:DUF4365 domain-containing protein [Microbacterium sp.]|uniref:DUF4365 domain-containing protein n=1 Tax=Microbacterium sp. TaxID=51671 RepID=UPI003A90C866
MASKKKPTRARTHELEDESYTKFRAARPSAWPVHKFDGSDDYGRDLLVEIFKNSQPTGNEFSVQLKARERLDGAPKVKLKMTTLNHWEDQPSPTLIVLWDAAADQLYYEWAHRLPWSDPTGEKKTRTIPVPHRWTDDTPAVLAEEADAYRKVRDLGQYFPVDLEVVGDEFFGEDAGAVVAAVIDALAPFKEFKVTFGKPQAPFVRITVLPNGAEVSLSGTPIRRMTYGATSAPRPEVIAGDVLFGLSFAVGTIGRRRDVAVRLMQSAVSHSYMAMAAGRLADAVAILASSDAQEALATLVHRTLGVENHPNAAEALLGLELTKKSMSDDLRKRLALGLEADAEEWQRPAAALRTAAWLVGPLDPAKAIELWDAAAAADVNTTKDPRYWSERGGIFFLDGQFDESVKAYKEAVRIGDEYSRPLLADALMLAGKYAEALKEFERSNIREGNANAEWRLKLIALTLIVDGLGIKQQNRDEFIAERMWQDNQPSKPSLEFIEEVLAVDALYGWASWAACPLAKEEGELSVGAHILAAVSLPGFAPTWQELAVVGLESGNWDIARDALLLARRFCGQEFIRMIHTDSFVTKELKGILLGLWAVLDDEPEFLAVLEQLWKEQNPDAAAAPPWLGSEERAVTADESNSM